MGTAGVWTKVGHLLASLPGINRVRLLERGAFLHYNPKRISKDEIYATLHEAGFTQTC